MKKKLAPLWLVLLVLVTFAPALRDGFVWDDQALILRDPLIRSWNLIGEGFAHFLFTDGTASDFYRPIQRLSYTLDYAAFFFSPLGYHLVSILWHGAATVALFFFAEEFLARCQLEPERRFWVAFLTGVVWALHPIQSAAVVYVAGRADPLAAAFGFFALYLLLRMWRATENRRWALGLGAGGCFLASALSKEAGLIFLLILLLLTGLERRRAVWLGTAALTVSVLFAYLSLRLTAEHTPPPTTAPVPLLTRPIIAARAVAEYAGVIVFPWHLRMERDVATHPEGPAEARMDTAAWRELQTLLGLVLGAAYLYGIWRSRRRPAVAVPLVLAAVTYLPISGLITLNANVAEHWCYLPSAFLFLGGAAVCETSGWPRTKRIALRIATGGLTIWMLLLPVRTLVRTFDWKDQRTFLTRTIRDGGDSARMWINLGGLELNEGHLEAAHGALDRALAKEPENPLALLNLAAVTLRQGDYAQTRNILKKIVEPPELRARAEESLVVLENRETGRVNLLRLRLAARLGPPNWSIEQRYVKALNDLHFPDRAITELKTSLSIAPYRAESWQMMSDLLRQTGRPNEAAIAMAEAEACDVHLHEQGAAPKF